MTTQVIVPRDLWDGDSKAVIACWLFDDGARVDEGALVAEVMMEKTQYEIRAPAPGVLRIKARMQAIVEKGAVIGVLE